MKKKVLIVVLTLLLCIALPSSAFAGMGIGKEYGTPYAVTGGNIYFDAGLGGIVDCDDTVTEAIIPNEIGGLPVTIVDFSMWYADGYENVKLKSITIPSSVNNIVFHGKWPASLTEVKIAEDNATYCSDGSAIFNKDKTTLIAFVNSNSTSYTIPDGVVSIGQTSESTFISLDKLTSITIPVSVTYINNTSFIGCDNLKDVYYQGTKEQWEKINSSVDLGNGRKYALPRQLQAHMSTIHFGSNGGSESSSTQTTKSNIKIMLNGSPLSFNEVPYMSNGTTMVPMRVIFEALKAEVNYDSATQKITANKDDTVIELVLGQKSAKKNGQAINLDVAAITRNGNTMVPLRFVAEALNAQVDWDNANQTVSITLNE